MAKRKYTRKPHRVKKKKSIFSSKFFWFGLLVTIIKGGFFYLIFFSAWFQITEIKVTENEKVYEQAIQELIQPQIEQQIGFWGTRSIFLANLNKASKTILEEFSLIEEVEIKRDFPNTLVIAVEEREPVAIFYHKEQKFFIDKKGVVFEEVTNNQQGRYLKIESLLLTKELRLSKRVLEKELISQVLEIERELKKIDIPIVKALIVSDERLDIKTLEEWKIYFNLKDALSAQILHLNLVLKEKIPQEKRKNLEYIDLRFGNRVFFRYYD